MEQTANFYDVVVIGGGPAGLTAALYLARARYRVVVVEKDHFGGQITITSEVVNYPGVGRTSGTELTETMRKQAEGFGAEFLLAEVTGLELSGDIKTVRTGRGDLRCFGVLLATGAHPRMVGFQGEEQFRGRGVAYCATCDGEFFTGKDVFVVGGGFAAAEESVFLTKYARQVTILIRGDDFTCAQATADAARNHEKITVLTNTEVEEVSGDTSLRYLRYRNTKTGQVTKHHAADGETFGVFVFAGYEPATELVRGLAELNDQGYILTDRSQKTTADGLYAAGDVCVKPLRQVVTAVGDGALAATELEHLCAAMQEKTGIHPKAPVSRAEETAVSTETNSTLFTGGMLAQLHTVFARMAAPLVLRLYLDETPLSAELKQYMEELAAQSSRRDGAPALCPGLPAGWELDRPRFPWGPRRPRVHLLRPGPLQCRRAGAGSGRRYKSSDSVGPEAYQIRDSGLPLLYHVPGTGDGGPADRRGKSAHHRPGL